MQTAIKKVVLTLNLIQNNKQHNGLTFCYCDLTLRGKSRLNTTKQQPTPLWQKQAHSTKIFLHMTCKHVSQQRQKVLLIVNKFNIDVCCMTTGWNN